ncbi:MAG TPA: S8/S53 family peptidase, partial [Polyangiaceae bacterium]|nr:S8/S53 family peptidase [Polyangiaceae bacterium]
ARLPLLRARGLLGRGVALAVVDDGIQIESLRARLRAALDLDLALDRSQGQAPFPELGVEHSRVAPLPEPFSRGRRSHGSMCAYDACLAAPGCTLLDLPTHAPRSVGPKRIALILAAYRHLSELARARRFEHLVVLNSWQTLPSDALMGLSPEHPRHPLYQALCELEAAGADVIFSAPDHHAERIHGPALHPCVLTVTAVNLDGSPFDSSVERLCRASGKPDVANYQGFAGYELFRGQPDYGTSAAAALTAGLVASLRSHPRAHARSPAELRALLRESGRGTAPPDEPGIVDVEHVLARL